MQLSMVLPLLLVTMTVGMPEEHQYCAVRYRRLCQGKGRHIACQFPDPGPGSSCERYTQIKFTNDLKHFITHYLNRRRQRIAVGNERVRGGIYLPKPQIMMLVEWDRELAQLAQRLADQCHFVHDDCRATVKFPYAGQTVGEVRWRRSSDSDELSAQRAIRRVLDAWWGERRRVQPKQLTSPFRLTAKGTVWGHFSQLAVWNLQAVGCGAVRHGARHPRLLLVCDFSHTNMLGQKTLVPGAMASCPIHTARRPRSPYPALCGPVRHPMPTEPEDIDLADSYDDDEDDDDEDYVETGGAGEIPTTHTVRSKKPLTRFTTKDVRATIRTTAAREYPEISRNLDRQDNSNEDFDNAVMTPAFREEPTRVQLDSERETEIQNDERRKAMFKNEQLYNTRPLTEHVTNKKKISRPYMQWRKNQEESANEVEETVPLTNIIPHRLSPPSKAIGTYRPTFREERTESPDSELLRHRWKQTRIRPQRPGMNALLNTATTKFESKKPVVGSLSLDKDDIDQLFRDTGFNLNWRKKNM